MVWGGKSTAMPDSPENLIVPAATDANARDGARKRRDPNEPSAVVGLGASAGGVAVLQQFFAGMATDSGLAFVVVMHLAPDFESNLASILQVKTAMPVIQVHEPAHVLPNHVYVIPPNKQLIFENSFLRLVEGQSRAGRRVTIDLFFRTLAQSYGQRAICVILTGSDSDGVIGLKHIRAQGGVTVAQDPQEAEYDSMPLTAISTGMVDWVLPVAQMPTKLIEFVQNEQRLQLPPEIPESEGPNAKVQDAPGGETVAEETRAPEDESALQEVLTHLRRQTGHDFTHYKRATVLRRVTRRLQVNSIDRVPEYLNFLRKHPAEARALLQDLLIGVTHFFRDEASFAVLEANIPQLFVSKGQADPVRVWVVGCATGEEAYSIAMLLCEHAERLDAPPSIQLFATDIDEQAVHEARDGLYPATIEADVSQERLRRFFSKDQGRYRVKKELREKVLFATHNLLRDAPFSRVDLVSCRNLLIYLKSEAQAQAFDIFHFSLCPNGLLFIGGSETTVPGNALFSALDTKHRLYERLAIPRPAWKLAMVPMPAHSPGTPPKAPLRARTLPPLTRPAVEDVAIKTPAVTFAAQERRSTLFGELHLKLLEQYGPPSLVVNEAHDIVHLSENAGRYLHFVAGEPSANLLQIIHPDLRIELRTALFRAAQSEEKISAPSTRVEIEGEAEIINLHVRALRQSERSHVFYLVVFEKETSEVAPPPAESRHEAVNRELDGEVQFLKEQLNATIEQYEASNEELKASNEELLVMNEEMRSAAEELETSKEELQSANEELSTVNHELKSNIEELGQTNTDLNNLMGSTDIGTVFLDRQLRIKRFTPSAQTVFNLLPADIGRPLSDITHKLAYPELIRDAMKVLGDLVTIEREVQAQNGAWLLTRIAPYRTAEDRLAGVVATFIDISRRKRAEDEVRESEACLRRAMEIETVGVLFFTKDGRVTDANKAFLRMSGYTAADLKTGKLSIEEMTAPEWRTRTAEAIAEFKRTGRTTTYEKEYLRKDGTRWWGLFSANVFSDDLGVKFVLDITDRKKAEHALAESEQRFREFAENSADVFWIISARTGQLEYLNPAYEAMFGESRRPAMRNIARWAELIHPQDRDHGDDMLPRLLAGEKVTVDYRIIRPNDGAIRWIRDRGFPIRDENGTVNRVAGVLQDITDDKEGREALAESEERFRLLVEGARDYAIFMLDPGNRIIYWSAGAERNFGWTSDEALGQSGQLIFTPEDRKKKVEERELRIALRDGVALDCRWHMRKDGSRLWVDGVMRRLDDEHGNLRGFAKVARDATRQRAAEQELEKSRAELEERVFARTAELTASNRQLAAEIKQRSRLEQEILLISEREKRRIGEDLHDSLCQELAAAAFFLQTSSNKIAKQNPREAKVLADAARIVNDNVGLARDLARGLHPVELSASGLTAALRELAFRSSQGGIKVRFKCPKPVRISDEAIALSLYRIAQEAVINALKNGKAKKVVIALMRQRRDLVLSIVDDGKGFSTRRPRKGLGLHLMKYRANSIGGELTVESADGHGAKIICTLPAR